MNAFTRSVVLTTDMDGFEARLVSNTSPLIARQSSQGAPRHSLTRRSHSVSNADVQSLTDGFMALHSNVQHVHQARVDRWAAAINATLARRASTVPLTEQRSASSVVQSPQAASTAGTTATAETSGDTAGTFTFAVSGVREKRTVDGLFSNHAYTIADVREVVFPPSAVGDRRVVRMVKVRAGRGMWQCAGLLTSQWHSAMTRFVM